MVPSQGQEQIFSESHSGHLGVSQMKSLAWMFVWWPKLDEVLEQISGLVLTMELGLSARVQRASAAG